MGLYVTYLDCMECEGKECISPKGGESRVKRMVLPLEIGDEVYLVFTSKREGAKTNIVMLCEVDEIRIYKDMVVFGSRLLKILTKNKPGVEENIERYVSTFMFRNSNIDTGRRSVGNYPVFTAKEKCINWLKGD